MNFISQCLFLTVLLSYSFKTFSQYDITTDKSTSPPCLKEASEIYTSDGLISWPHFNGGDLLKINSLTPLEYPSAVTTQKLYYLEEDIPEGFSCYVVAAGSGTDRHQRALKPNNYQCLSMFPRIPR